MKKILINNIEYELLENYKDGYDIDELTSKLTEYFYDYDYIIGDWAYGKLRLKGFYESNNSKVKNINNINNVDQYIKNNCAYNCKYFIAKRVYKK